MSPKEFAKDVKDKAFVRQNRLCAHCGDHIEIDSCFPHFRKPSELGGDVSLHNCIMLCPKCHLQYGHISRWGKFVITQDYPYYSSDGLPR